jgi:hypothetical protein
MLRDASSRVLSQETDNPYKVYHPIWDQIGELQEHYKVAWQTLRNHHEASGVKSMMVPPKCPAGKDAVTKVWSGAARDIAVTTLWLLANQKQTTSADKDDPQALTNTALGEISTLNWGTTMNRSVNLELFPDLFTDLPDDLDESFFTSRGNIFVQQQRVDSSVCTWAHPSLRSGPWTVQAGCAGGLWLTTPSQKARDNATELFRLAERRSGIPVNGTEAGRYDSGLAILAIGSLIAEKTIYMGAY